MTAEPSGNKHTSYFSTAFKIERIVVLVLTGLEIVVHGGVIWGWPSYVYILKQDGYFGHFCGQLPAGLEHIDNETWIAGYAYSLKSNITSLSYIHPQGVNDTIPDHVVIDEGPEMNYVEEVEEDWTYESCDEQDAMIQLIFTVSMGIQQVSCCWFGFIVDKFGIRFTRLCIL